MLARHGLHPQPVKRLTRDFEVLDGPVQPRFTLCFLGAADTPGLMSVVLCQHLTPELLRRPEWLRHANGALGVRSVTGVVPDLAAAADAHAKLFGEQAIVDHGERLTVCAGDRQFIELVTPDSACDSWAGDNSRSSDPNGCLLSLSLEVHDLNDSERCLAADGVRFQRLPGAIRVPPSESCGVPLEFVDRT